MKRVKRNVFFLGITSFFTDWSSEMLFPILPDFMANVLGIPKSLIGVIDGVSESAASLLKVFSGYFADKLGKRKPLAFAGYSISAFVKPVLALANSWLAVFGVRLGDRIGKGIRTAPRDALIADSCDTGIRGRQFGFHRAMDTLGAVFGTFTAFLLLNSLGWGYRSIFALTIIPGALAVFVLLFGVREKKLECSHQERVKLSWSLLSRPLKILITAHFVHSLGAFTFTFVILRARDMGISAGMIPLAYLLYNITYAGLSYPSGIVADTAGRKPTLAIGYLSYVLVAIGFSILYGQEWAWVLMAFYGVYHAFTDGVARTFVSDLSEPQARATALGIFHTAKSIADLPAGLIAGFLWEYASPQTAFMVGAILSAVALAILVGVPERKH